MIKGTGIDIVEISRIQKSLNNEKFINRIFTQQEQAYCNSRNILRASSYAARFAAKEAVVKAFGTGMRGGSWQDIEVVVDDSGAPHIKITRLFCLQCNKT